MDKKVLLINILAISLILGILVLSIGAPNPSWDWNNNTQSQQK